MEQIADLWNGHEWNALEELDCPAVGHDPGRQIAVPGRFGIGVVAGPEYREKNGRLLSRKTAHFLNYLPGL